MLPPDRASLATQPHLAPRAGEFELSAPVEAQQFGRGTFAPGSRCQKAWPPLLKRLTGILRSDASSG
jgi:hypothetical protein